MIDAKTLTIGQRDLAQFQVQGRHWGFIANEQSRGICGWTSNIGRFLLNQLYRILAGSSQGLSKAGDEELDRMWQVIR